MGTVEFTGVEIILGLIAVISTLAGVLAAMTRWMSKQIDVLRTERDRLETEHKRELDEQQRRSESMSKEIQALRFKYNESENARLLDRDKNEAEIATMRQQLNTLLDEVGALRAQVKTLTEALDSKTAEAERNAERARQLEKMLDQRDRELGDLQAQVRTYERVVSHFGDLYKKQQAEAAPEAGERLTKPETGEVDNG